MTIKHLRIFVCVYQNNNFTKAAEQLYMTQPAVSRAIREIEDAYKIDLFEQLGKRLYVTEAGKMLYHQAEHILKEFDAMEKTMKNWNKFSKLRVGADISIVKLPKIVRQYNEIYPNVEVSTMISRYSALKSALLNGELDLLVVSSLEHQDDDILMKKKFEEEQFIPIVPPDSPLRGKKVTLQEMCDTHPVLLFERGSYQRSFLRQLAQQYKLSYREAMESSSISLLIESVRDGLGCTMLTEHMVQDALARQEVATCTVPGISFTKNNYVIWHRTKEITQAMDSFIQLCEEWGNMDT